MRDPHTNIRRHMNREKKRLSVFHATNEEPGKKRGGGSKISSSCHKPVDSYLLVELIYSVARVIIRS